MTYVLRGLTESERRPARELLTGTLHGPTPTDETWRRVADSWPADRKIAAFDGTEPVGITSSMATEIVVPGGARVPAAAVDGVGVRADHTRRGLFTRLMQTQLEEFAASRDVLAVLYASESVIYGRVGYGPASRGKTLRIDTTRARMRADVPAGGRVRLLTRDAAIERIPSLYRRLAPDRTGMIVRPPVWWPAEHDRHVRDGTRTVAVHTSRSGTEDGFVTYGTTDARTETEPYLGAALRVFDLHAAGPEAAAGLWRFLLGIDLTSRILAPMRPLDEPVDAMLVDPRCCATIGVDEGVWLRLVDVPAALSARGYGAAAPVVVEVADPMRPGNSGRYRLSTDGACRTREPAAIRLGVDVLAMLYLGDWRASTLAELGRIEVDEADAVHRLDALFATARVPWCGSSF